LLPILLKSYVEALLAAHLFAYGGYKFTMAHGTGFDYTLFLLSFFLPYPYTLVAAKLLRQNGDKLASTNTTFLCFCHRFHGSSLHEKTRVQPVRTGAGFSIRLSTGNDL
tara:strand:+ start:1334 stop:1660 length:327 start_codon:yes stop_codon:yes gene_type:complete